MDDKFLDIEFAIDNSLNVYILQVRSITTQPNWNRSITNKVDSALNGISNLIRSKLKPIDGLYGKTSVFGQMPDWNPAEMIGRAPRALAFSLYEKLITNDAWRISRKIMGYSVPEGKNLMISLAGQPFIDTRLSFHSYLPKDLDKKISNKLVNEWISALRNNPEYHDKIEFEIAVTTFSFDFNEKIKKTARNGFKKSEIDLIKKTYLNQLLNLFSKDHPGSLSNAIRRINLLSKSQEKYFNGTNPYDINHLNKLIDECINFGTIPFSILARHGFIAKTLLLSLKKIGIIEESDITNIFKSIKTIAGDLVSDMKDLQYGKIKKTIFMEKYGHLRPGTYDIMSQCYKDMEGFLKPNTNDAKIRKDEKFKFILEKSKKEKINSLLKNEGFGSLDYDFILKYIHDATAGREYGKFIFTKTVSHILEIISKFGNVNFLSKSELSHIPIDEFLKINSHSIDSSLEIHMREISDVNKEKNLITSSVRLPQILFDEAGIFIVPFQVSQPNFITSKQITEDCINISDNDESSLEGKIVLIENADPGYDWIFSQNISGLITKYGGANSHMAIRCAEFDIPAAIGCGEQRYNMLKVAKKIMIDCSSSLIKIIE